MKRIFLLFVLSVFCCLRFPAAAQEQRYTVTERELIRLESISENLARDRQKLQSQANSLTECLRVQEKKAKTLTEKLQQAESTANSLNSQLQTERATLKDLRQSYSAYEIEAAETIAEKQALIDEQKDKIDKQKDKLHRLTITVITLLTIVAGFVVFTMIKLKRFFPFLP